MIKDIYAKYIIIIILFIVSLCIILKRKIKFKINSICFASIMAGCLIVSSFLNNDIRLGYFYQIGLICLSLLIISYVPFHYFLYYYDRMMCILAVASLVGFGLYVTFNSILVYFPIVQNIAYMNFYNLFLTVIPNYFYAGMVRNYGVFREPGVFQIYLIMALIFQLFVFNKSNVKICILYIIVIITTFSTTGYFALFFTLGAFILKKDRFKVEYKKKLLIVVVFFIMFAYLFLYTDLLFKEGYGSVFGKLTDLERSTTVARLASFIVNIKLWFLSPFWGVGLTNLYEQYPYLAQEVIGVYIVHNTNTLLVQFAAYGLIYGTIWWYGIYRLCKQIGITKMNTLFIFIIFNILFIGENITFSLVINVLLFYGFTCNNNEFHSGHCESLVQFDKIKEELEIG